MPSCRSCGCEELKLILSLGRTPLANSLLTAEQLAQPEPTFPLDLAFCPRCTLVQILETVPPEQLFSTYLYFSSYSTTMLASAEALASRLAVERGLGERSLVVEVASNDGYLLQYYKRAGVPVLGIEPAANIACVAEQEKGIPTRCQFFGLQSARDMAAAGERADVIHANNVLAHVADLNGFVSGLRLVVKDAGVVVIEVPYLKPMFDHVEFDTIYHEHLSYFSVTALRTLFERGGLQIADVERLPIHGGSLRLFLTPAGYGEIGARPRRLLEEERAWGVDRFDFYRGFADRVIDLRGRLTGLLRGLKAEGKQIVAYGAAAKGNTLLNTFGIGRETIDYVVDRNPHKQGLYLPGTRIPIYAPERIPETRPDYVLILPWNLTAEIVGQMGCVREWGGRFIVPIPDAEIV